MGIQFRSNFLTLLQEPSGGDEFNSPARLPQNTPEPDMPPALSQELHTIISGQGRLLNSLRAYFSPQVSETEIVVLFSELQTRGYTPQQIHDFTAAMAQEWGLPNGNGIAQVGCPQVIDLSLELEGLPRDAAVHSLQGQNAILDLRDYYEQLLEFQEKNPAVTHKIEGILERLEKLRQASILQKLPAITYRGPHNRELSVLELVAMEDSFGGKSTQELRLLLERSGVDPKDWYSQSRNLMEGDAFGKVEAVNHLPDKIPNEYESTLRNCYKKYIEATVKVIRQAYRDSVKSAPDTESIIEGLNLKGKEISAILRQIPHPKARDFWMAAEMVVRRTIRGLEISAQFESLTSNVKLSWIERSRVYTAILRGASSEEGATRQQNKNHRNIVKILNKYAEKLSSRNADFLRALSECDVPPKTAAFYQKLFGIHADLEGAFQKIMKGHSAVLPPIEVAELSAAPVQPVLGIQQAHEELHANLESAVSMSAGIRLFLGASGVLISLALPSMFEEWKLLKGDQKATARAQVVAGTRLSTAGLTATLSFSAFFGFSRVAYFLTYVGLFYSALEGDHQFNLSASSNRRYSQKIRDRYYSSDLIYSTIKGLSGTAGFGVGLFGSGFLTGLLAATPPGWAVLGIGAVSGGIVYGLGDRGGRNNQKKAWADNVLEKLAPHFETPSSELTSEQAQAIVGTYENQAYIDEEAVFFLLDRLKESNLLQKIDWHSPAFSLLRDRCYEALMAEFEAAFECFGPEGASALIYFGMQSPNRDKQKTAQEIYFSRAGNSEAPFEAFLEKYQIPEKQKFQIATPVVDDLIDTLTE